MLPKLIILHGLNNNSTTWDEFEGVMNERGFKTVRITLPRHGDIRDEGKNFEEELKVFDEKLRPHIQEPYVVVAYSLGALFFENWLIGRKESLPLKQVLLAPCLLLRREKWVRQIIGSLLPFIPIPSIAPRDIMLYKTMFVWEYRNLLGGLSRFQKSSEKISVPSLVIIDPKDELIDGQKLKEEWKKKNSGEFYFLKRPSQKWGPSYHHILFHSKYFTANEWSNYIGKIENFLKA
ncbi:MAG: alpha/beta hydrolase [Bacteriovoracaceae bacterium]